VNKPTTADRLIKRFRTLCLSFPEVSEMNSWGHPNFRAGKRTFATVEWVKGRPSLAFRLGATAAAQFRIRHSEFFYTPYGRDQWLSVWIDAPVTWQLVESLVDRSYRLVALKRLIAVLDGTLSKTARTRGTTNARLGRTSSR
jgi:predicted DNA-binding protein (MmcQ/YjbR family)